MQKCKKCGKEFDNGIKFCPECGKKSVNKGDIPMSTRNDDGDRSKYIIIILSMIIVFIIVLMALMAVLKHKAKIEAEEAYNRGIEEAGPQEVIEVTNEIKVEKATVKEIIAPASDLVAYKYYYTDVGQYEKNQTFFNSNIKIPFTTDKTIYEYSGVISAGVTISKIEIDVNDSNKTITVTIPEPIIMSHVIDNKSFKTYDVKNSVFTASSLGDFSEFQDSLKETQEEKLRSNDEFWESTKKNVQLTLDGLLKASSVMDDYKIVYEWKAES